MQVEMSSDRLDGGEVVNRRRPRQYPMSVCSYPCHHRVNFTVQIRVLVHNFSSKVEHFQRRRLHLTPVAFRCAAQLPWVFCLAQFLRFFSLFFPFPFLRLGGRSFGGRYGLVDVHRVFTLRLPCRFLQLRSCLGLSLWLRARFGFRHIGVLSVGNVNRIFTVILTHIIGIRDDKVRRFGSSPLLGATSSLRWPFIFAVGVDVDSHFRDFPAEALNRPFFVPIRLVIFYG